MPRNVHDFPAKVQAFDANFIFFTFAASRDLLRLQGLLGPHVLPCCFQTQSRLLFSSKYSEKVVVRTSKDFPGKIVNCEQAVSRKQSFKEAIYQASNLSGKQSIRYAIYQINEPLARRQGDKQAVYYASNLSSKQPILQAYQYTRRHANKQAINKISKHSIEEVIYLVKKPM